MIGQKIGPFEVVELLGKGGMGEVYRARDLKLNREVALKILPQDLGAQPDRLARFRREATLLASLQHQNIASIFGLEEFDGQPVLVMELAPGDDLSERLEAGNLTSGEIEKIARQMARGLEYAHENGIIHRDLKPANVKVHGDGKVKILDFGLARAMENGPSQQAPGSTSFMPTVTQGLTVSGTVLGTAAYMSPEQARGYDLDRRSDIWSFGVILFEMLTGQTLFAGQTATDTLASILRQEPDWSLIPEDASSLLVQICKRCLEKDPSNRMRDIGEVRVALEGSSSSVVGLSVTGIEPASAPTPTGKTSLLSIVAIAVLAMALGAVTILAMTGRIGPSIPPAPMVHASVSLPDGVQMNLNPAAPGPVTVSPDGSRLAFTAIDTNGQVMLYVRDLDEPEARPISGTNGAHYPFWSPDNRTVAFFTNDSKVAKVDVAGGPIVNICSAENGKGGTWNGDDTILFAPSHVSSIYSVPAAGGQPVDLTALDQDQGFRSHRFPVWLPDGKSFLYIAVSRTGGGSSLDSMLRLGTLDDPRGKDLMPTQTSAAYAAGQILHVHDSILMSRPFDLDTGEFTGPAQPLMGGVLALPAAHLSVLSVSRDNVLAYSAGSEQGFGNSQLFIADGDGSHEQPLGEPLMTYGFDLHPDGNRVLLSMPDGRNGTFDVWILEIDRNLRTRFTFNPETELQALWTADGQWVVFSSDRDGVAQIYRKKVTGTGSAELLFPSQTDCTPNSISRDGKYLAFTSSDSTGRMVAGIYDFQQDEVRNLHGQVSYSVGDPCFSPDARWIAFSSNETGQREVFVESMEPEGGRYRLSSNGGHTPQWSPKGDRLYYLTRGGEVRALAVQENESGGLRFGSESLVASSVENNGGGSFIVSQDTGQIILMRSTQNRQNSMLSLVTSWQHLLEKAD